MKKNIGKHIRLLIVVVSLAVASLASPLGPASASVLPNGEHTAVRYSNSFYDSPMHVENNFGKNVAVPSGLGKTIKVLVDFEDDAGLISEVTAQVIDSNSIEKPAKPTGLTGVTDVAGTVTLTWNNPQDNTITEYRVLRRTMFIPDDEWIITRTNDTTNTTHIDSTVEPGGRYLYRIQARNIAGLSKRSHLFRAWMPTVPHVPLPMYAEPHDVGSLEFHWRPPTNDGGSYVTGYTVQWKLATDSWDIPNEVIEETTLGGSTNVALLTGGKEHILTGLTAGAEYDIRVKASNIVGDGPFSGAVETRPIKIWRTQFMIERRDEYIGYSSFDDPDLGYLSSNEFSVDGINYIVKLILHTDNKLYLGLNKKIKSELVLSVGIDEFASVDATMEKGDSAYLYWWNRPDLNWTDEEWKNVVLSFAKSTKATYTPFINGVPQIGETLRSSVLSIGDVDGLENVSYEYQWIANDIDINGANGPNYSPLTSDLGKTIRVRVDFEDDAGNEESLTSPATGEVYNDPTEPPERPQNLIATGNDYGTVTIHWEAPNNPSIIGHQILRKRPSEGENSLLVYKNTRRTITEFEDNRFMPGIRYVYRVRSVNAAGMSKRSKPVSIMLEEYLTWPPGIN